MATSATKLETAEATGDTCREFMAGEIHAAYTDLDKQITVKLTDYVAKAGKARDAFKEMFPLLQEMQAMLSQRGAKRTLMDTVGMPTWTAWFADFKKRMQMDVTIRTIQRWLKEYLDDEKPTVKTRKKPLEVDSTLLKQMAKYLAKPDKKKAKALAGEITRRQDMNKLAEATICEDLYNRLNLMLPAGDVFAGTEHVVIDRMETVLSKLEDKALSESDAKLLPHVIGACKEVAEVWGGYAKTLEAEPAPMVVETVDTTPRLEKFLSYLGGPDISELTPEAITTLEAEMNDPFHAGWEQALETLRASKPTKARPKRVYSEEEYWKLWRKTDRYKMAAKLGKSMAQSVMNGKMPAQWVAKMFTDFYEIAKKR